MPIKKRSPFAYRIKKWSKPLLLSPTPPLKRQTLFVFPSPFSEGKPPPPGGRKSPWPSIKKHPICYASAPPGQNLTRYSNDWAHGVVITPAQHPGGPGFNPSVSILSLVPILGRPRLQHPGSGATPRIQDWPRIQVPGTRYHDPGARSQEPGSRTQHPGSSAGRTQGLGSQDRESGTSGAGSRIQRPVSNIQDLGTRHQAEVPKRWITCWGPGRF